jgi:hypothetical protein
MAARAQLAEMRRALPGGPAVPGMPGMPGQPGQPGQQQGPPHQGTGQYL